jgi:two-component system, LytTR family, response regulator
MKAVIVEDEALARRELRVLLDAHPEIEVVGEAASPAQAAKLVAAAGPDLLFLDVNLRAGSGFDLLESLRPNVPPVIFTTARADLALQAFDFDAVDYLLKPINPERLAKAIAKLQPSEAQDDEEGDAPVAPQSDQLSVDSKVLLRDEDKTWYVAVGDIWLVEAEGNYSRIHFAGGSALVHRSLTAVEARLPAATFFRANRSQLVNTSHIASVEPWFSQTLKATLRDKKTIEFSRRSSLLFRETRGL